jgi:hypothetical protein
MDDVEAFVRRELSEPLTAELTCDGAKSTVEITATADGYSTTVIKKASDPKALDAQFQALTGVEPPALNLSFNRSHYSEKKARLSVLRSAYLVAFAVTGYRLLHRWGRIRHQILEPAEVNDALIRLVRYERENRSDQRLFSAITEPREIQAYYVNFGRWAVVLPFRSDSALYQPAPNEGWNFTGTEYEWPLEPSFGMPTELWPDANASSV